MKNKLLTVAAAAIEKGKEVFWILAPFGYFFKEGGVLGFSSVNVRHGETSRRGFSGLWPSCKNFVCALILGQVDNFNNKKEEEYA